MPAGRDDLRHPHAGVPADRHPVRGLLRAAQVRQASVGHLHRHAVGRQRPERDARAQLRLDQQHQRPRGVPGPPPPALGRHRPPRARPPAHRRPRVRRRLGHVQRADDARAGLRRRPRVPARDAHGRDLAGLPDHPRRADAPRRADGRRGDGLPGRAHRLRARQRPGRGLPLHLHADVPAQLPARQGAAARLRADEQNRLGDGFSLKDFHDTLLRNGSLPISFHRRLLAMGARP